MNILYLDFEYYNTAEPMLSVVCCSTLAVADDGKRTEFEWWLHDSHIQKFEFELFLKGCKEAGYAFASYNVIAEARAIYSLGIDPLQFKWIDLMLEWKQLRNGNYKRLYGKYIDPKGNPKVSYPPPIDELGKPIPKKLVPYAKRQNNSHTGTGLLSCIYNILDINLNAAHKDEMRDRILKGGPFSSDEQKAITDYAKSDTKYLPAILRIMKHEIMRLSGNKDDNLYFQRAFVKGEWAARCAIMEAVGIPVNLDWLKNIGRNAKDIKEGIISTLVADVFPFYEYDKKKSVWVEKRTQFAEFIKQQGLEKIWPKTESGAYSTAKETLEDYEEIPEILEYRRARDSIGQLRSFKEADRFVDVNPFEDAEDDHPNTEGKDNIFQRIGSDGRLRCFFNPYGTQTSRNAPPAKNFILAMSAWLRSCIQPPEGYAITAVDYSSEEFIIAACEAQDRNMETAYDSGDVYIGFAKLAGAVPTTATKKSHPVIRDEFKAVVLGMQFSLGIKKLHRKLTRDTGVDKGEDHARDLARLHRDTFSNYWDYNNSNVESYTEGNPLRTRDGWFLFCDNPNPRSAGNFPIQGAGGAILRRAVKYAQNAGLMVISPLHDALYIQHRIGDAEVVERLKSCMNQAFKDFYKRDIRMDAKTWNHGEVYIEGKGKKSYHKLKQHFMNAEDFLWMKELE